jgi:dTDP-4-amino-4,6-dideoxygalactose transaminase/nucleoside-diphosphate-sugar epimerase
LYDDVVVGGAGFVGSAITRALIERGRDVLVIDRHDESRVRAAGVVPDAARYQRSDVLIDPVTLPEGRVILAHGISQPRIAHPWQLVQANAWSTARLLPQLHGRDVVLLSSVEVYGAARGRLTAKTVPALPIDSSEIRTWCSRALAMVRADVPSWQVAAHCRALIASDPTGRWAYALSKRAQELLLLDAWEIPHLRVLRVANVFGRGQERVIDRLARRMLAGLPVTVSDVRRSFVHVDDVASVAASGSGNGVINAGVVSMRLPRLVELISDALGVPCEPTVMREPADPSALVDTADFVRLLGRPDGGFVGQQISEFVQQIRREPPAALLAAIPVVSPPQPERPDVVARQISAALESGVVKGGGPMTQQLRSELRQRLQLDDDRELLLTSSGTAALRLALVAGAGVAEPGQVALMPSFTFAATAEAAVQLGYRLQFCDVDASTWTLDPTCVERALEASDIAVVIAVDALGNPADYARLRKVCDAAMVPLVADSAPALGSAIGGVPVGNQAPVHAFSMSFAKTVSAGGAGGFLTLPREWMPRLTGVVDWTRSAMLGEVHAAVALDQVQRLDEITRRRNAVAEVYADLVLASGAVSSQHVRDGGTHSWVHWTASFAVDDLGVFSKDLEAQGVLTKPYYSPALHQLEWGGRAVETTNLPVTSALAQTVLALPMSSEMTVADADSVLWRVLATLADASGP